MSYLGSYGAGEAQREHSIKKWLGIVLGALVLIGLLVLIFRNFSEKRQLSTFLDNLKAKNFAAAYAQYGCTDASPCRDYSMVKFMEDWGPASKYKDVSSAGTTSIRSCKTSLVSGITFPSGEMVPMVVNRSNKTIGFAPYPYSELTKVPQRSAVEAARWWLGDLFYSCE